VRNTRRGGQWAHTLRLKHAFRAHDIDDNPGADGRPLPTPNAKNRAPIAIAIIDSGQAAHSLNSTLLTRAISRVVLGHPIKAMPTDLLNPKWLMFKTVGSAAWVDVPAELGQSVTRRRDYEMREIHFATVGTGWRPGQVAICPSRKMALSISRHLIAASDQSWSRMRARSLSLVE